MVDCKYGHSEQVYLAGIHALQWRVQDFVQEGAE